MSLNSSQNKQHELMNMLPNDIQMLKKLFLKQSQEKQQLQNQLQQSEQDLDYYKKISQDQLLSQSQSNCKLLLNRSSEINVKQEQSNQNHIIQLQNELLQKQQEIDVYKTQLNESLSIQTANLQKISDLQQILEEMSELVQNNANPFILQVYNLLFNCSNQSDQHSQEEIEQFQLLIIAEINKLLQQQKQMEQQINQQKCSQNDLLQSYEQLLQTQQEQTTQLNTDIVQYLEQQLRDSEQQNLDLHQQQTQNQNNIKQLEEQLLKVNNELNQQLLKAKEYETQQYIIESLGMKIKDQENIIEQLKQQMNNFLSSELKDGTPNDSIQHYPIDFTHTDTAPSKKISQQQLQKHESVIHVETVNQNQQLTNSQNKLNEIGSHLNTYLDQLFNNQQKQINSIELLQQQSPQNNNQVIKSAAPKEQQLSTMDILQKLQQKASSQQPIQVQQQEQFQQKSKPKKSVQLKSKMEQLTNFIDMM